MQAKRIKPRWATFSTSSTATVSNRTEKIMAKAVLESTLTCPHCGHTKIETMPTDACQWFYECTNCKTVLKPKPGDCCVYCSYGDVPCPPIQESGGHGCCG